MSTKPPDFKVSGIRLERVIASGSAKNPQLLVMGLSAENSDGINVDTDTIILTGTGSDTWFYVSGSSKDSSDLITLGGTSVISGSLFLVERTAPTSTGGKGAIYVSASDGLPYFKTKAGVIYSMTSSAPGGSGSPGGSNTQVQFNDGGSFAGSEGLTYSKSDQKLSANLISITGSSGLATTELYVSGNSTIAGNLTVNGTTTTINTTNLLVKDPLILFGSGSITTNSNGGIALASGSSDVNKSLVWGRVSNDTWGAGKLDVTNGTTSDLTGMQLVPIRAAKYDIGGSSAALTSSDGQDVSLYSGGSSFIKVTPGSAGLKLGNYTAPVEISGSDVKIGSQTLALPGTDTFFFVSGSINGKDKSGIAVFGGDLVSSGTITSYGGLSGSLTRLSNGTSYLVAGSNVTISTSSNGQITISSSGGGGGSGPSYWTSNVANVIFTTGSAYATFLSSSNGLGVTGSAGISGSLNQGYNTIATGQYSHAEGYGSTASGNYSHAEGYINVASGIGAHAEGYGTISSGSYSHAEGYLTTTQGDSSHAEGENTTAIGNYSHAEGYYSISSGSWSHAEGAYSITSGSYAHAEGTNTLTVTDFSHAEGSATQAGGKNLAVTTITNGVIRINSSFGNIVSKFTTLPSTAYINDGTNGSYVARITAASFDGTNTYVTSSNLGTISLGGSPVFYDINNIVEIGTATGGASHAEGYGSYALAAGSHAEGSQTQTYGIYSHAEGRQTVAAGDYSHAAGINTLALGRASSTKGLYTTGSGLGSSAEGELTIASGSYSHAEGASTIASGLYSHAEGANTFAIGEGSHAEGLGNYASGDYSHAAGQNTTAAGSYSQTSGFSTIAYGQHSRAEGDVTIAVGDFSHAAGTYTIASGSGQTVIGKYNNRNNDTSLLVVGNGTGDANNLRSDVFLVETDRIQVTGSFIQRNSGSSTTGFMGNDVGIATTKGTDVFFYVSGSLGGKGTTGVALFGGDVVISGTLHSSGFASAGASSVGISSVAIGSSSTSSGSYSLTSGYQTLASGDYSHAEGAFTTSSATYSHAEGYYSIASGLYSHAEGANTFAIGEGSHSEGFATIASGEHSHAEGFLNFASGSYSHSEGYNSITTGSFSHAEGEGSITIGSASHSEGLATIARGDHSHAEGQYTVAYNDRSHAEGYTSYSIGQYTHAEGYETRAGSLGVSATVSTPGVVVIDAVYGDITSIIGPFVSIDDSTGDFIIGYQAYKVINKSWDGTNTTVTIDSLLSTTTAYIGIIGQPLPFGSLDSGYVIPSAINAHSEGKATQAVGPNTHAEGFGSKAAGEGSHAEGQGSLAIGAFSHAEGNQSIAYGINSHAEGSMTYASGTYSHAEGEYTLASGQSSHAEGYFTTASNFYSHAEGSGTRASGYGSHAEGLHTTASNNYSHAEGQGTQASGILAHAEGFFTVASGEGAHAVGSRTLASANYTRTAGLFTTASAAFSHAEGNLTLVTGQSAHTEGGFTTASFTYAHAEGSGSLASGRASHAEGEFTISAGTGSHSQGLRSAAIGSHSFAGGIYSIASGSGQTVFGQYNKRDNTSSLFVVGNGTGDLDANRSDVLRIETSGLQVTGSIGMKGDIIPDANTTYNLGTSDKRWANVYTGDLHLRNDRGDWTIVEEEDYLCVVNNKSGKRYKMMLQPID